MADLGTVSLGLEVRNKKSIVDVTSALERMQTKLLKVAVAERNGTLAAGSLKKAQQQLRMELAKYTGDLGQANTALANYYNRLQGMDDAQLAMTAGMAGATRGMNRMGVGMQQLGYQVGDFVVQVQSGTNAFVAFGQQATQLVSMLPMMTKSFMGLSGTALVAFSAGLGIVIPLLTAVGAAFMRTRENADKAKGGFQGIDQAMSAARDQISQTADEIERLNRGLESNTELNLQRAIEAQRTLVTQRQAEYDELQKTELDGVVVAGERLEAERNLLDQLVHQLEVLTLQSEELETVKSETERRLNLEEDNLRIIRETYAATENLLYLEDARIVRLREAYETTQSLVDEIGEGAVRALRLAGVDLESPISSAAKQAAILADKMGMSLERAAQFTYLLARDPSTIAGEAAVVALEQQRIEELRQAWAEYLSESNSGSSEVKRSITDIINARQAQLDLELELLGISGERAAARRIEFQLEKQYQGEITETMREQIQAAAESMAAQEEQIRKLEEIRDRNKEVADTIANSFGKAFTSIMDGTKSASEAFKDMARQIIADLYQIYVVKQITGFISQAIDGFLGGGGTGATGANYSGGSMRANEPYLVGENGPELVIPRKSSTVVNADLTSKAMGGGGETVVVNQTINVSTGVQQTVRNEIQNLMPQISEAAKSAVVDAKRRGGSYGRAFG